MPIYAYRCTSCGFERDHLQKLSDSVLQLCPQCGQTTYQKQVTAAGFQLKGNGWYATDFKDGNKQPKPATAAPSTPSTAPTTTPETTKSAESAPSDSTPSGASACAGS